VQAPISHRKVSDSAYGNDILYFEPTRESGGKVIEIKYTVQRKEKEA
jgi:hypothetical protein